MSFPFLSFTGFWNTLQQDTVANIGEDERMPKRTVGQRVREAREALKMSRRQLEAKSGVGYSTLSELERGGMKSTTMLPQIADALGVSATFLATGKDGGSPGTRPIEYEQPADDEILLVLFRELTLALRANIPAIAADFAALVQKQVRDRSWPPDTGLVSAVLSTAAIAPSIAAEDVRLALQEQSLDQTKPRKQAPSQHT